MWKTKQGIEDWRILEVIMAQHGAPHLNVFETKNMKRMVILKLTIDSMTGKHSEGY